MIMFIVIGVLLFAASAIVLSVGAVRMVRVEVARRRREALLLIVGAVLALGGVASTVVGVVQAEPPRVPLRVSIHGG